MLTAKESMDSELPAQISLTDNDSESPREEVLVNETQHQKGTMEKSKKANKIIIIVPIVLLLISTVASFFIFQPRRSTTEIVVELDVDGEDGLNIAGLPRDRVCPLTGGLFTAPEEELWQTRRPLAVIIENTVAARPQSGLGNADIVFEVVAEGGITRFLAIYYCNAQAEDITLGPVRSVRTAHVDLASGFNLPLIAHVGGANAPGVTNALGQLGDFGWNGENAINQFSVGFPTFVRDYNRIPGRQVATEHTMVSSTDRLWAVAERRGWTNMTPARTVGNATIPAAEWSSNYTGWTFEEGSAQGSVNRIAYGFWSGMPSYDVVWNFDAETNKYLRNLGGEAHIDHNTGEQLAFSNVVVLQAREAGPINEERHMTHDLIGTGTAFVFNNGEAHEVQWSKPTRESELEFTLGGSPFVFTAGPMWISIVDVTNTPAF
ncbi:MAG: DUF3048 domain-containing protein [Pseudomonadales bacterium]|jgi:hypothetical protein|nr:DUF3048 domain-containing protein [Pseudomonadales bacterium]